MLKGNSVFLIRLFLETILLVPFSSLAEDLSQEGGDASISDQSSRAYDHLLANANESSVQDQHDIGKIGFDRNFAHTRINGRLRLGPQFNNVSCIGCHTNNGRGTPNFGSKASQSVVKISLPAGKPSVPNGSVSVPGLGTQLRDHAISKVKPDAHLKLLWDLIEGQYDDGIPYELRKPKVIISLSRRKIFPSNAMISLRRAPPVFGTGLLESVDEATIISLADPDDADYDGISGHPNMVWNLKTKKTSVGRFGFKAGSPTAIQQIATAYSVDMGVTNPLVRLTDKIPDITKSILDATTFYTRTLAVPRSRSVNPVKETSGKNIFYSLHCNSCHVTTLFTGVSDIAELSHQVIHPFTDLLLHDMGPGLADGRPEFLASGNEWRTTPLWGIGLTATVLFGAAENYLHDGRARTLEEAILWHGGEGQQASNGFKALSADQRDSLICFLHSL
jgi:CxxC motif-containing protein (DUF1111 family)